MKGALRVVVGVSGASGAALALSTLERLAAVERVELHLVMSSASERSIAHELGSDGVRSLGALAHRVHDPADLAAPIASGSFRTEAMIVVPCSMTSLAAIATGLGHNLLVRAAAVHVKERRRLVLLPREAPLHLVHLRNMCTAAELGAVIMPPVPAFYLRPRTAKAIADQIAARAIDLLGLPIPTQAAAWGA